MDDDVTHDLVRLMFDPMEEDAWNVLAASTSERQEHAMDSGDQRATISFAGPPSEFDVIVTCPDCGRTMRDHGITFGPMDHEAMALAIHRADARREGGCPALRWRLFRIWWAAAWTVKRPVYRRRWRRARRLHER